MKHISILVLRESIIGNVSGPHLLFSEVNQLMVRMGKRPLFKVNLVGFDKEMSLENGLYQVRPELVIDDIDQTDLIIIPAFSGDPEKVVSMNAKYIPWIVNQYKAGAEVASLCMGAFLLASTGLLKGKKCATHWAAEHLFRKMHPGIELLPEKIITDEHGIYTSGAAFSWLNLILYLIEKYAGRETAVYCSKVFAIEIERNSQSPFIIFHGQKEHEDEPVKKAQEFIEKNYQEKITVDQLTSMLALGRRNLERRFKKATSNTVVEYLQRVRMEAAKMSLESSRENVNEVMYNVGYTDPKAFRTTFKKITGLSPLQYRGKYNREVAVAV
jgi:transcriptional regulator GlxA family with amidase domain